MNLKIKTKNPLVRFSDLKLGDVFRSNGVIYIKTNCLELFMPSSDYRSLNSDDTLEINSVSLVSGILYRTLEGQMVEVIDAQLEIL